MSLTVLRTTLVLVALVAAATACGEDSADDTTTTTAQPVDIVAEANVACANYATVIADHRPFPFDDFDPENPDPAKLPDVGAYFAEVTPGLDQMLTDLKAIETDDSDDATNLEALITAVEAEQANSLAQQDAAKNSDVAAFVATLPKSAELGDASNDAARTLGATACVIE